MNFANRNQHKGDEKDEQSGANRKRLWTSAIMQPNVTWHEAPVCASNWSRSDQWRKLVVSSINRKCIIYWKHLKLFATNAIIESNNALHWHDIFNELQANTRRERTYICIKSMWCALIYFSYGMRSPFGSIRISLRHYYVHVYNRQCDLI